MSVFNFEDYRAFIRKRVDAMPRKGHGEFRKMAEFLGIQTSMLSQIMAGHREMNAETAASLCEYFGLNDLESDYFLCLVQIERAGSARLKAQLRRQLEMLHARSAEVEKRVSKTHELDDTARATFYSQWYYSGIRLLTAIEGMTSIDAIVQRVRLPRGAVARAVEFLLSHGLCQSKNGKLSYGPQSTHIGANSPLVTRHHLNWRLKAMENLEGLKPSELVFTSPVVVSVKDAEIIRRKLLDAIEDCVKVVDQSPSERLMCLNVDWVEIE
jgi:uncharacterized protein (TIGR02147 family)